MTSPPFLAAALPLDPAATFVAIDFETADYGADSACAVGLVRIERGQVVARAYRLIKPPARPFVFTHVHGLTAPDVEHEGSFAEVWAELSPLFEGVAFVAAHNAAFDRGVVAACCEAAGLAAPELPWLCTVQLARQTWAPPSARLSVVCELLGLPLDHHQALSDAEACAGIVLAAGRVGLRTAA